MKDDDVGRGIHLAPPWIVTLSEKAGKAVVLERAPAEDRAAALRAEHAFYGLVFGYPVEPEAAAILGAP